MKHEVIVKPGLFDGPLSRMVVPIWLGISALLIAMRWEGIVELRFPDPDDTLRLIQVRDWLGGQSWFDVTQYRMNPPDGVPMHWSRLVDLPIALVILLCKPLFGQAGAEIIACVAVPLLTLLVLMSVMAHTTNRMFGRNVAMFAVIMTGLTIPVIQQLQPLRIDHHGWQLVCVALALWGMLTDNQRRGGIVTGAALASWVVISVEGLPMVAATLGLACLGWLSQAKRDQGGTRMVWLAGSLATTAAVLTLGTRATLGLATYCDTLSPIHVALFATAAAGIITTRQFAPNRIWAFAGLGATALLCVAMLLYAAPQCAGDAFATLDPLVRHYWYENVMEGRPIWDQSPRIMSFIIAVPLVALAALLVLLRHRPDARADFLMLGGLVLCALAVAIMVQRAAGAAALMAIPAAAWASRSLLEKARKIDGQLPRIAGTVFAIMLLSPSIMVSPLIPSDRAMDKLNAGVRKASTSCVKGSAMNRFAAVIHAKGGGRNIFAPLDISPAILIASDLTVVASGHHRNQSGMHDVIAAFTATPAKAERIIRSRPVDYIAYCGDLAEPMIYAEAAPDGLMAQLENGKVPNWLNPVRDKRLGGMRVYRVVPQMNVN